MSRAWHLPALALLVAAVAASLIAALSWSWTARAWAAPEASSPEAPSFQASSDGFRDQEISLEWVPAHFQEEIRQARKHLAALLRHRQEAAARRFDAVIFDPVSSLRWEASLDGIWSYYPIRDGTLEAADPSAQRVPQEFDGPKTAWYGLRFFIPPETEGKRLYLLFEGVTLYAEVYVNGAFVGAHGGRFTPFEVDITEAARIGEENVLHILNASAALAYDRRRDAFYYQVGGTTEMERLQLTPDEPQSAGIWGSVRLAARPHVHVVDQFVVPSVRRGTLTAQVTVANRSGEPAELFLRHRIQGATDPDVVGPQAESGRLTLMPGQAETVELEIPWSDPILWDLERPFLYWFVTEIVSGDAVIDTAQVRFGFREFWIEGPDFVLNGSKVRLMGESGVWPKWDPRPGEDTPRPGRPWSSRDRPGVEALFRAYKEMNMTALRLHYRIGTRVEIEVAEELGLLLIPQSGIWTLAEGYERGGSEFLRNLRREFEEWIVRDRNSPAVVIWDVENEILRWGRPATRRWALELDRWVKELDPSRVILHSGGGKFGEQAQAYSFHMAENYDPVIRAWEKNPDKPVILGEWWIGRQVHHGGGMLVPYGWTQTRSGIDPHHLGRRDRIEMHRIAGVHTMPFDFDRSLIYPALPMSTGQAAVDPRAAALYRDAFSPLFVGLKERGATAVAGETLRRTAVVINDTPRDLPVRLSWRWYPSEPADPGSGESRSPEEAAASQAFEASGEKLLWVPNGGRVEVALELVVPNVKELILELDVRSDPAEGGRSAGSPRAYRMTNAHHFDVFPEEALKPCRPLEPYLVFDPEGSVVAWMERHGIPYREISGLSHLDGPVLIIGRDALAPLPWSEAERLHEYVRQGGRVLIMEQSVRLPPGQAWHHPGLRLPTPWLPGGLAFWSADISVPYNVRTLGVPSTVKEVLMSRYAAVLQMNHPVARGLPSQLLAHWRAGDGRVVDDAIQVPGGIAAPPPGVTPIVGAVGPDNASLVQVVTGDGLYLINQLEIVPNLDVDPAATRLFLNMLKYLEPEVVNVRLPLGLARGEIPVGIDVYVAKGWRLDSLTLWIDDEPWLAATEPIATALVDTLVFPDGDHRVTAEARFETPEGPRAFQAESLMVISNWRELRDELEPPRPGWFGQSIKQLKTDEESQRWRHVEDEAERYFGDRTRMTVAPGTEGPQHLVWRMPRLKKAEVVAYVPAEEVSRVSRHISLAGSADKEAWTRLAFDVRLVRQAGGVAEVALTVDLTAADPAARPLSERDLPGAAVARDPAQASLNWFRLEMVGLKDPDAWQLGRVSLWGLR